MCFVTTFERAQQILENKELTPPPSVEYRINGTELLTIPGKVRETAFEVLFDLDADEISLPTMILNSLVEVNEEKTVQNLNLKKKNNNNNNYFIKII